MFEIERWGVYMLRIETQPLTFAGAEFQRPQTSISARNVNSFINRLELVDHLIWGPILYINRILLFFYIN
jgi:hypothetical protein